MCFLIQRARSRFATSGRPAIVPFGNELGPGGYAEMEEGAHCAAGHCA